MEEVEKLEREAREIGRLIGGAAVAEDAGEFLRLQMRKAALSHYIREAKAAPVRAQIARLEEELEGLGAESERIREEAAPTVPASQRGHLTPTMLRNRRLVGVGERGNAVGGEVKKLRKVLAQIEAEGPKPLP